MAWVTKVSKNEVQLFVEDFDGNAGIWKGKNRDKCVKIMPTKNVRHSHPYFPGNGTADYLQLALVAEKPGYDEITLECFLKNDPKTCVKWIRLVLKVDDTLNISVQSIQQDVRTENWLKPYFFQTTPDRVKISTGSCAGAGEFWDICEVPDFMRSIPVPKNEDFYCNRLAGDSDTSEYYFVAERPGTGVIKCGFSSVGCDDIFEEVDLYVTAFPDKSIRTDALKRILHK